jgi:hypothetical protein
MNRIDPDAVFVVHEFLSVVDLIKLRYVCRETRGINIAKIFRRRMIAVIQRICCVDEMSAREFLENVDRHNGVISGSAVLQALYGHEYKSSDIDIYVNKFGPNYQTAGIVLRDILKLCLVPNICPIEDAPEDDPDEEYPIYEVNLGKPLCALRSDYTLIYNFKSRPPSETPYRNVQIIKVQRGSWLSDHQSVTDHFDMTIVMNSYSGKTLEVFNSAYLASKRNHRAHFYILEVRVDKYRERGFPLYKPFQKGKDDGWHDLHYRNIIKDARNEIRALYVARMAKFDICVSDEEFSSDDDEKSDSFDNTSSNEE